MSRHPEMYFLTQMQSSFQLCGPPPDVLFKMTYQHHRHHHRKQCSLIIKCILSVLAFASPSTSLTLHNPTQPIGPLLSELDPRNQHAHAHLHLPLPNHLITQFPNPAWLENIAVRSNGDLLLTESAPTASLHLISSSNLNLNHHSYSSKGNGNGSTTKRTIIHTFDSVPALFGITETVPDLFVVVGGNVASAGSGGGAEDGNRNGSPFFAWSVDFRPAPITRPVTRPVTTTTSSSDAHEHETNPKIKTITHLSKALLPNGLTSLPPPNNQNTVLIADSFAGLVWSLDIQTEKYEVAVKVPEMAVPINSPGIVGVNGIKVHQGYLYWTNSAAVSIYRVKLDLNGHHADNGTASVELVADLSSQATFLDDFAIGDDDGVIWVATNSGNKLFAVDTSTKGRRKNRVVLVGGGETEMTFAGDTAVAFARGASDRRILYVTTCGGLRRPINGTVTEGGKVVAVDTSGFWL